MKTATIRILDSLWKEVRKAALSSGDDESVAFLTAKYFETSEKTIFLVENFVPAKPNDYLKRSAYHLEVSPLYVNRVLNVAEDLKNTAIMVHSHPFETGRPRYSFTDDNGEALTSETISKCLSGNPPVGSLLIGQNLASARGWHGLSKEWIPANVTILGRNSLLFLNHGSQVAANPSSVVDRQVRALGTSTQSRLEAIEVGIVGLGGTGSAIAEQLVRMGVKKLRVVDHDTFEPCNWSRLYGSKWKDTRQGRYKVDIINTHLKEINPKIELKGITKSVMTSDVLKSLSNCDIVFSCLDRHAPRAVLNELSYQCLVPVIDVGVGLQRDQNGFVGGAARATFIVPGMPCLFCQDIVRPEMITAEHLSPEEYESRRAKGYVNDHNQNAPSVICYTSFASSLGLILFLDLISERNTESYSTILFNLQTKETMKLRTNIKTDCVCQKRVGKAFHMPFSVAD